MSFTPKQNKLIFAIIIGVIVLSSLAYLVGYFWSGQDHFLASNHLNAGDVSVYLSYIEQVKQGQILVGNLFTSEPQKLIYFTPWWLLLGLVAKICHFTSVFIYQFSRIILAIIFLYFLFYYFLDLFFKKFTDRLIVFLLTCLSSGVGIFFVPKLSKLITEEAYVVKYFGIDLFVPEANTFLSLAHSSLFILSQLLIIICFYLFLKPQTAKRDYFLLPLISLFLGFVHPYDAVTILSVLGVYLLIGVIFTPLKLIERPLSYLLKYILLGLGFAPACLYFYLVLPTEPALWGWFSQNVTNSGSLLNYLMGFGLLVIFSFYSLYLKRQQIDNKIIFLVCWIVTLLALIYLPVGWQRKLINTTHIAWAILAGYSLIIVTQSIINFWHKRWSTYFTLGLFLFFFSLGNFSFLTTDIYDYMILRQYFYWPSEYWAASTWLKNNSTITQAILAAPINGMFLPPTAGRPIFLGHRHQTINFYTKEAQLNKFFQPEQDLAGKKEFLHSNNIQYIFYTEREKALGDWDLAQADFLQSVYANPSVTIYQVQ